MDPASMYEEYKAYTVLKEVKNFVFSSKGVNMISYLVLIIIAIVELSKGETALGSTLFIIVALLILTSLMGSARSMPSVFTPGSGLIKIE